MDDCLSKVKEIIIGRKKKNSEKNWFRRNRETNKRGAARDIQRHVHWSWRGIWGVWGERNGKFKETRKSHGPTINLLLFPSFCCRHCFIAWIQNHFVSFKICIICSIRSFQFLEFFFVNFSFYFRLARSFDRRRPKSSFCVASKLLGIPLVSWWIGTRCSLSCCRQYSPCCVTTALHPPHTDTHTKTNSRKDRLLQTDTGVAWTKKSNDPSWW